MRRWLWPYQGRLVVDDAWYLVASDTKGFALKGMHVSICKVFMVNGSFRGVWNYPRNERSLIILRRRLIFDGETAQDECPDLSLQLKCRAQDPEEFSGRLT